MTAREFFFLVADMRQEQQRWFATHDKSALIKSKLREKEVDFEIRRVKEIIDAAVEKDEQDQYLRDRD